MRLDTVSGKAIGRPTAKRLFEFGIVLAVGVWSAYVWLMSTPGLLDRNGLLKGTDFLHFYTLGTLANQNRGTDLYDIAAQTKLAHQLVPEAPSPLSVPMYPPQVSLVFAPLARLSYGAALAAWLGVNTLLYFVCCYLVWRVCPHLHGDGGTVAVLAIAYPGFFHLLLWGQTSGLALLCFTLAYLALASRRVFLAGLAVGSLVFKPPLGVAAAFVFTIAADWKLVAGALTAATTQLAIGWAHYGTGVMRDYASRIAHLQEVLPMFEPRPYQMHSLRAFWALLLPDSRTAFWLYVASSVLVLVLALRCWRSAAPLPLRYGVLLLATVLVSPHLTVYDLVILTPTFVLIGEWMISGTVPRAGLIPMLLMLAYLLPLVPQAKWTHVQLSVVVMGALVWSCTKAATNRA